MLEKPHLWVLLLESLDGLALALAVLSLTPTCSQRKDRLDCLGEMLLGNLDVRNVAETSSSNSSWEQEAWLHSWGGSGAQESRVFSMIRNNCRLH